MRLFIDPLQQIRFAHGFRWVAWNMEGLDLCWTKVCLDEASESGQVDTGMRSSPVRFVGAQDESVSVLRLFEHGHYHIVRFDCEERIGLRQSPFGVKGRKQGDRRLVQF